MAGLPLRACPGGLPGNGQLLGFGFAVDAQAAPEQAGPGEVRKTSAGGRHALGAQLVNTRQQKAWKSKLIQYIVILKHIV